MNIPITLEADEKGYLDRECPNENCLFDFKVNIDDWKNKISDEEVHCPLCGHIDSSDKWWTQQQIREIEEVAKNYVLSYAHQELGKIFKQMEKSTRNNKFIKVKYNPGKKITFSNNPIGQSEEWNLDITCKQCKTRYSVIGNAYFCPCCGYNSVEDVFDESLDTIKMMLSSIPELRETLINKYGNDKAESITRSMIEDSLENIVSAFQKFAESKFVTLSNKKVKVNDFQIIDKGSNLFREVSTYGYDNWIDKFELNQMNIYFQRRHLIEHNNGIVDEKYINKTNDNSYSIGQRIVIKDNDVYELLDIIKKLTDGLKSI